MGSTRLPGKVLRSIAGRPLLAHVLGRLADLRHDAQIVVATSTNPVDDVIYSFCAGQGMFWRATGNVLVTTALST
jgi:spore coat polysaccharide biosynthesis protein SpsF